MQRYALHSTVAKLGESVSVMPHRRALSESSLPSLSPERIAVIGVPPTPKHSKCDGGTVSPPGDPKEITSEKDSDEYTELFVPKLTLPGRFMLPESEEDGPWTKV